MQALFSYMGWLLAGLYGSGLIVAAVCDIRAFIIPNACVVFLAGSATAGLAAGYAGLPPVWPALATAGLVLAAGAGLFFLGAWGAGDAKLMAAVALWVGPSGLANVVLLTALAGGLISLFVLVKRRHRKFIGQTARIPYGVAIAAGGLPHCFVLINAIH